MVAANLAVFFRSAKKRSRDFSITLHVFGQWDILLIYGTNDKHFIYQGVL